MKLVDVMNTSKARLVIRDIRGDDGLPLRFEAEKPTPLPEKLLEHAALRRYFRAGILKVEGADPAPKPPAKTKPKAAPKPAPKPEPTPEPEEEEEEEDLREFYKDAPGITENNVDAVLAKYPSIEALIDADEDDLVDCGVRRSFVSRILEWAAA